MADFFVLIPTRISDFVGTFVRSQLYFQTYVHDCKPVTKIGSNQNNYFTLVIVTPNRSIYF